MSAQTAIAECCRRLGWRAVRAAERIPRRYYRVKQRAEQYASIVLLSTMFARVRLQRLRRAGMLWN